MIICGLSSGQTNLHPPIWGHGRQLDDRHRHPNINISEIIWLGNQLPTNHPHRGTNSATGGAKHTARGPGDAEGVHPVTQQAVPHQYHSTTKLADKYAPPGLKIEETTRQVLDQ